MLTYTQGEIATVAVPFTRDGEPFVPDAGTVSWTLRGTDGTVMTGYVDQPLTTTDTTVLIEVPSLANSVSLTKRFEKRFLVVKGLVDGDPFQIQTAYQLTAWLNHTVTPDAVRSFVGTDTGELADIDIDIVGAYFEIADMVGEARLTEALSSGLAAEAIANKAIKGQAVLNALPGLRQRMAKRNEDGTLKVERFAIDFDALAADAGRLVAAANVTIGLFDDTDTVPVLFVLATPTIDVMTNAAPV